MKERLDEVRRLYTSENYADALRVIGEAEEQGRISPAMLVWKSCCMLLSEDPVFEPSEVEKILQQALSLDDEYLPAMIDLAYFYLNMEDDAEAALPLFKEALSLCADNATEIIIGLGQCLSETESPGAALEFLESNAAVQIDPSQLQELKAELKDYVNS
jgi:tetratricopeptide (TPR) repeat protein